MLIPKPEKDIAKKENQAQRSLKNLVAKVLTNHYIIKSNTAQISFNWNQYQLSREYWDSSLHTNQQIGYITLTN